MSKVDREKAARAIDAFLAAIGRDAASEPDLAGTGARVADAFVDEICEGYAVDVAAMLRANVIACSTGSARASMEIVVVRDIAVTTMCPHHLMPAVGKAAVAFAPRASIVGLGSLAKLVDAYAHRLTLQERIGESVVDALIEHVKPAWAGCRLVMDHMCVVARGERRHGAKAETVSFAGDEASRAIAMQALGLGT